MKLFELIRVPVVRSDDHAHAFMRAADRGTQVLKTGQKIKVLGSGVEAVVFSVQGEIGVIKVMTTRDASLNNNPYLKYVSIARRYANSNPFLPRVTHISTQHVDFASWQILKAEAGVEEEPEEYYNHPPHLLSFKMEQLVPLTSLDLSQLQALYLKAFGEDADMEDINAQQDAVERHLGPGASSIVKTNHAMIVNIAFIVNDVIEGGTIPRNVSPQLIQAVKLINSIAHKTKSRNDLHANNMMARMTTGGPQLVLTDPLIDVNV